MISTGTLLCIAALVLGVDSQGSVIQFTRNMDGLQLREDLDLDATVYTLQATVDGERSNTISYSILDSETFIVEELTGVVRLARLLDFENAPSVALTVRASSGTASVQEEVVVSVKDINDEAPVFVGGPYMAMVVEDTPVNSVVVENITVTDIDTVNTVITVECATTPEQKYRGGCDHFAVRTVESSPRVWQGELYIKKALDAEQQSVIYVLLRASDGVLGVSTTTVQVDVNSIQDAPPEWFPSQLRIVNINENEEAGISVFDFTVTDKDTQNKRSVQLEFASPVDSFRIEESDAGSYSLILTQVLDREDPALIDSGSINVFLKACEVLESGELGTSAVDCSYAEFTIRIDDLNDNTPSFNQPVYEVNIPEDISVDTPLPNLNLVVNDPDQGDNAVFEVVLLNHNDIFTVMPSEGTRDLTASIYISNVTGLDYESDIKSFELNIRAQELNTREAHFSSAVVQVNLVDINDNPPEFAQGQYMASVLETANPGTPVINITATDKDSGNYGEASLFYKLIGNGADKFKCDKLTGQVTIASCASPGSGNCLDAEQTSSYSLTFIAADQNGEKFLSSVPLQITVVDVNDNTPVFAVDYVSFITEGETEPDPTVQVKATDADSADVIEYRIVAGNQDNIWQIGLVSGIITATRPVDYEALPRDATSYVFSVEASDGQRTDRSLVTIYVIDINDHAPQFVSGNRFQTEIPETSGQGKYVYDLEASDQDRAERPSGQIEYRITGGAQDKFTIDSSTGVVSVARDDAFDYNVQNKYEMTIKAVDQGSPQKSATAILLVNIRDVNNKDPYFDPALVRREVREDAVIGQHVVDMVAIDPDSNSTLVYFLEEPSIKAYDPQNQLLPSSDSLTYRDMFTIVRTTGKVLVNKTLDYERVARYEAVVKAVDNAGLNADQSATASLIITILQVNRRPPVFGTPWSPNNPFLNITVNEEQPKNTYVTTLVATDPTDTIKEYNITEDPGNHFQINSLTGEVTIRTPLDYEKEQSTRFVVVAVDNGQPELSSTATVLVNVNNINDESPQFGGGTGDNGDGYNADLAENSPGGTTVIRIQATDDDLEDYGVIRFTLDDPQRRFIINSTTGIVTVAEGADLDRETEPTITLTVTAYDSPNNPVGRRFQTISLVITLGDGNDNQPRFRQNEYLAVILENVPAGTTVLQIGANDADTGPNGDIMYYKMSGDPRDFFTIDPSTGVISTNSSLMGFSGRYQLTIGAVDDGTPRLYGNTSVKIQVLEINNLPPIWVIPSTPNTTVSLIEKQYEGGELIKVHATDPDPGRNGQVEYGFLVDGEFVDRTPEFVINRITGVISAGQGVEFDRERQASYTLLLVARDKGTNPLQSTRYLIFEVEDINDNRPYFDSDCCPRLVEVYEDEDLGTWIGTVTATDKDVGTNAKITYSIIGGNTNSDFMINHETGNLTINNTLDHERQNLYNLTIFATDGVNTLGQGTSATVVVYVRVLDRNDFVPEFLQDMFTACVSIEAEIGKRVTTLEAVDPDSGGVSYDISQISGHHSESREMTSVNQDGFVIGRGNGTVYTNMLMDRFEKHYFTLRVVAEDEGGQSDGTDLYVWVTEPSQEVTMTFNQPPSEVREKLPDIIQTISRLTDGGIVCVGDLTYHITVNNVVDRGQSDLTFHVVGIGTYIVLPPGTVISRLDGQMAAFGVVDIKESYAFWDGFVIDPVLAAVIIIFILLFIALLLLCCLCWCLGFLFKRTETYGYAEKPLYLGTVNPLWGHKFYEDQELHMAVKDFETVQASPGAGAGVVNKAFDETDVAAAGASEMKVVETKTQYHYEKTTGGTANGHVMSGTNVRIEAPLEGGASGLFSASEANMVSSNLGSYSASMTGLHSNRINLRPSATVTDDERSEFAGSTRAPSRTGFGATLTRPDHQQERVYGANAASDFGGYRHHSATSANSASHYRLYTGSQSQLPAMSSGSVNLLQPVPPQSGVVSGLSSSSPNLYSYSTLSHMPDQQGYIDLIDGGAETYQGEIHVGGGPATRTTYVERRETREVLN